jgi:LmbE family N-acetylglucosaminyl deacetylase/glycosyltransferase involved in cell wall biosynthesis
MPAEHELIPYQTSPLPPAPWLVFAPHADDESIGMGGTLLLGARRGYRIEWVVLTDGAEGGDETGTALRREEEAREAARRLGIQAPRLWRLPDRGLTSDEDLVHRIAALVQELNPASVFFPAALELHPDHRAAAALVWAGLVACEQFAGTAYGYEISVQSPINRLIDVTEVEQQKAEAIAAYASQMAHNNYREVAQALNRARTYTLGAEVRAAEGFFAYPEVAGGDPGLATVSSLRPYWDQHAAPAPGMVSVIVRTKDRPDLLREALRSVADQTYRNLELVVVNDGGCDVSELLDEIGELVPRRQLLNLPVGSGRCFAGNAGLARANGELLAFLDDDDWYLPGHLAALAGALAAGGADVAYAGVECRRIDADGRWQRMHVFNKPFDPVRLRVENFIPMHAALFRRRLVEAGCRLDEALEVYEDWDLWLQMAERSSFLHLDRIGAVYRIVGGAGFGLTADPGRVERGLEALYGKWQKRWSLKQFREIAEYAKYRAMYLELRGHSEAQSRRLQQALDRQVALAEALNEGSRARESLARRLGQAERNLAHTRETLQRVYGNQRLREEEVQRLRRKWNHALHQAREEVGRLAQRVHDLEHSASWRLTRPLRRVTTGLRRMHVRVRNVLRLGRSEGPGALVRHALFKLTGRAPARVQGQGASRHALVIDMVMLTPDQDSGSLRMLQLLELIRDQGLQVSFVASNLELRGRYGRDLQERGIEVLHAPYCTSVEGYLKDNGPQLDLVIVSRLLAAERFLPLVRAHAPNAVRVFDTVDLHFLREQRQAELEDDQALARVAEGHKAQELALAESADVTWVVSPVEQALLQRLRPGLPVQVVSNIHRVFGCATPFEEREGILFIGGFNHPPNTDAVLYFVRDVLPRVQAQLGDVKFYCVGSKPPPEVLALASDSVVVTGFVPDVGELFNRCRLSVAPLRYGAGVKGKVNMTMAYGLPVVATTMASEGMYLTDGEDVMVADDVQTFAAAVVRLYRDPDLWARLSAGGLSNVKRHFSRDAAAQALRETLERARRDTPRPAGTETPR